MIWYLRGGLMSKEGIKSYKHLNTIIIDILKKSSCPMSAAQIANVIEDNYKTKKIFVKSLSIAKRCQGVKQIKRSKKSRGHYIYWIEDEDE